MGYCPSEMGTGQFPGKTELGHLSRTDESGPQDQLWCTVVVVFCLQAAAAGYSQDSPIGSPGHRPHPRSPDRVALWGSPEEPPSGRGWRAGGGGLRPPHTSLRLDLTSAWLRLNLVPNEFTSCSPKGNDQGWGQLNLLQARKESVGLPEPSSCAPWGNKLLSISPWGSCCGGTPPLAAHPGLPSAPTSHCSSSAPRARALVADSTSVWTPLYVENAPHSSPPKRRT